MLSQTRSTSPVPHRDVEQGSSAAASMRADSSHDLVGCSFGTYRAGWSTRRSPRCRSVTC